jgi:hypothetical protein
LAPREPTFDDAWKDTRDRMTLLEKIAVVALAVVYWPVLLMVVMALAGSGLLLAPLEVLGMLIVATALAYVTVRGAPKLRRANK